MQSEFRELLRNERHHSGIVWTRGNLVEDDLVTFHKQFNSKQAITTKRVNHLFCHIFSRFNGIF
ncbi:Uncharacterised protein [Vibrio cholerae]|nr:Uncharacterised protein [Vibrio cholerae]CSB61993.1 Uncharacterised protein [Vibrio cholerae]